MNTVRVVGSSCVQEIVFGQLLSPSMYLRRRPRQRRDDTFDEPKRRAGLATAELRRRQALTAM